MRGEIINEYQRLNSKDKKAFRRWLWANAVVGAILLTGLIAIALQGDESGATAASQTPLKASLTICLLDGPCDAGDHPSDHGSGGWLRLAFTPASFPKV